MVYFTPLMRFFSPFPHGTFSLSVTQEYLALRGGPRRFTRDFTCPMLLGIQKRFETDFNKIVSYLSGPVSFITGLSPSLVQDSAVSFLF